MKRPASYVIGSIALAVTAAAVTPACIVEPVDEPIEDTDTVDQEVLAPDGCLIGWNERAATGTCLVIASSGTVDFYSSVIPQGKRWTCAADDTLACDVDCRCATGSIPAVDWGCSPGATPKTDGCWMYKDYFNQQASSTVTFDPDTPKCGNRSPAVLSEMCANSLPSCDILCDVDGEGRVLPALGQTCCVPMAPPPHEPPPPVEEDFDI
jgi:hypothetical protein